VGVIGMADRAARLRLIAAAGVVAFPLSVMAAFVIPSVADATTRMLLVRALMIVMAAGQVALSVYLWVRLRGRAVSWFGALTAAVVATTILGLAWQIAGPPAIDLGLVGRLASPAQSAIGIAWFAMLLRPGSADPALPRLRTTLAAALIQASTVAVMAFLPSGSAAHTPLLLTGLAAGIWYAGWQWAVAVRLWQEHRRGDPALRAQADTTPAPIVSSAATD
jgi:hypothetical protein